MATRVHRIWKEAHFETENFKILSRLNFSQMYLMLPEKECIFKITNNIHGRSSSKPTFVEQFLTSYYETISKIKDALYVLQMTFNEVIRRVFMSTLWHQKLHDKVHENWFQRVSVRQEWRKGFSFASCDLTNNWIFNSKFLTLCLGHVFRDLSIWPFCISTNNLILAHILNPYWASHCRIGSFKNLTERFVKNLSNSKSISLTVYSFRECAIEEIEFLYHYLVFETFFVTFFCLKERLALERAYFNFLFVHILISKINKIVPRYMCSLFIFMRVVAYSLPVSLGWKLKCDVQKEANDTRSKLEAKDLRENQKTKPNAFSSFETKEIHD